MGRKKEERWLLFSVCFLVLSLAFFGVSFRQWDQRSPVVNGESDWSGVMPAPGQPVKLLHDPFFPAEPGEEEQAPATSQFVLRGVISGQPSMAILELATDPNSSWLVKKGDVLLGEKVLKIGPGSVELSVGEGQVVVLEMIGEEPGSEWGLTN